MAFYSYVFTADYKKFFQRIGQLAKKEKRFAPFLVADAVWCVFRYGLGLSDYFSFDICNRTRQERKEYVGTRAENSFYELVSPAQYKKRYTVKPTFLTDFKAYTKRDFIVPTEDNYPEFEAFLNKHGGFMSKPYDGLGGKDVEKVTTADITDREGYFRECIQNRIYLEELVHQHPDMNVLCPKSVNTIRIMTFNDHGKPEIIWMGLRVGNGVNSVDNFHAAGMGVSIDMETGKLVGNALDKDNRAFAVHPTTGVPFDGFQIPCFQEARELVLKAALESDKILVVGWDVAISENGPVIIEGNRRPGFDLPQVLADRGLMEIIRSVEARVRN